METLLSKLLLACFLGLLSHHSPSHCLEARNFTFLHEATAAPRLSYYDYIVVGGGTAGCPLAATLSQHARVLLLERGGSPYGNPNISSFYCFSDTLSDTSPSSPSQRFISEDGVINARARVLGGGSCLNAGFYTHASEHYVRDAGWDPALVADSYRWVESLVAFRPPVRQWQSAVLDGLIESGVTPFRGFTFEHELGTKVGGTIFDRDGHRHTSADLLAYADHNNLTVLLRATAHRILFRLHHRHHKRPVAHGVVYRDAAGRRHRAYLRKGVGNEIVMSAGAMGSPQLLMLSGVGPAEELLRMGIRVKLDQPLVGKGMRDNPMNALYVPSPSPVEVSLIQVVGITSFGSYIEGASGNNFAGRPSSAGGRTAGDFGMFSPQTGQLSTVPPKQRTPEAIARAVEAMRGLPEASFRGGFILEKVMGPLSSGHLKLRSRDPNDTPAVTFNYFQEPEDLRRCVEGVRMIGKVIDSRAFSAFRYPHVSVEAMRNMTAGLPVNLRPRHGNDSTSPEQFCRDTVMTIWHYHGGCQVGKVVDADYRVIGVDGLRVVDGSTFDSCPGTNPQATVMMLGRYVGVKMQNERLGKK